MNARETIELLKELIRRPSPSGEEAATADLLETYLSRNGIRSHRLYNNIYAHADGFDPERPTLMLNSHHDTVRPAASYTRDPYSPEEVDGRIYGLGSNDAGASVAGLLSVFLEYARTPLPFNLLLALSAEEERSGEHGMRALLPELGRIDMAIVGEPTGMQAAIGERGLVVLDCEAHGRSGHAAHGNGVNALYMALDDINRLRNFRFAKVSPLLGDIRMTATMISAGTQHNIVPDSCRFVVDVRTTDAYTNEQTVEIIREALKSDVTPRSTRIRASAIDESHPLVRAAKAIGRDTFVSETTSDMALMPFPTVKMGIGDSMRSHSANEHVMIDEIVEGLEIYKRYIKQIAEEYGH